MCKTKMLFASHMKMMCMNLHINDTIKYSKKLVVVIVSKVIFETEN